MPSLDGSQAKWPTARMMEVKGQGRLGSWRLNRSHVLMLLAAKGQGGLCEGVTDRPTLTSLEKARVRRRKRMRTEGGGWGGGSNVCVGGAAT
eukprot:364246-Chlamydomonas_euryale.AAC.2